MSGIMCVWANLPEEALDWYENEYLPARTAGQAKSSLYCQVVDTGLAQEPLGHLDAPWELMTVYEIEDTQKTIESVYDKSTHPPMEMRNGILKDARFDIRTYKELYRWGDENWDGDVHQVTSVTGMEWRVPKEEEEDVVQFYTQKLAPMVAESDDVLRFRLFEIENATVLQGDTQITKEKDALHTFFTLVEFETDEWPWDKVMLLAEYPKWRKYFESQDIVKWQTSHYMVERAYPSRAGTPSDDGDSKAEE